MGLVAVYLGQVEEHKINDMSIPFFSSVLHMLGKRINYDAVVNYAGNSFAKDSWQLIQDANPMVKPRKISRGFAGMLSKIAVADNAKKAEDTFGDLSWAT